MYLLQYRASCRGCQSIGQSLILKHRHGASQDIEHGQYGWFHVQIATAGSGSLSSVIETLGKLAKWPADQIFPVLDIFRLLVLNSSTARLLSADAGALEPANEGLGGMIARGLSSSVPGSRMVALRLACNCLMQQNLRTWLLKHGSKLLDLVADCAASDSKPFRAALATTLLNLGVAVHLKDWENVEDAPVRICLLYTSPSPRDRQKSRMPSSA